MKPLSMLVVAVVALCWSPVIAQEAPKTEPEKPAVEMNERESAFAKSLTGATLKGFFTVSNADADGPPRLNGDRYDMVEVRKLDDKGNWLFKSRIRYGNNDVTLPMTLPVEWAGDTPVIVVDNIGFPGLGTYSARVLFHAGHYAGHWSGANHGGNLFGTIERTEKEDAPE